MLALSVGLSNSMQAQGFFPNLFGGFGAGPQPPRPPMIGPFGDDRPWPNQASRPSQASRPNHASQRSRTRRPRVASSDGQAWCVRSCDGRYFPITGPDVKSREVSCKSFCPASQTELVYGNDIDHAETSNGKAYSQLPNAFKYRDETVAGCTCNGKDQAGLAPLSIDKDPTLQKGDIVASADGFMIAHPRAGKHAELNFTPVPPSVRARLQRAPIMARE